MHPAPSPQSQTNDAPLYLQLYHRYRDAIATGQLQPGERVPSVRSLASELNLARGTVEMAYQLLGSEGYFLARGPAGTVVSPALNHLSQPARAPAPHTAQTQRRHDAAEIASVRPLQLGLPALDAFPRKTWTRLAGQRLRSMDAIAMAYPDPQGYAPLRQAIASYLGVSRGIACTPEQVFITAGYRGALELVCRSVLQAGDVGWYEDPGYLLARPLLEHLGMRLAPVPVDQAGLHVELGLQRAPHARFAVVTPTHQSPTGVALSLPRRLQLLAWARHQQAWIIEDDYDSEFRYHGRPLPALKSLDRDGRVLYSGTFSKVLFPGLRLAYLVVPETHIAAFQDTAQFTGGPGALLPQATVFDFIAQGHFARHLRKMRTLYAARRAYLVDALAQAFGPRLQIQAQAGGLHVLANLTHAEDDQRLAAAAQAQGLAIHALSQWCMERSADSGLLMGFANLSSAEMARQQIARLAAAFQGL